MTLQLQVAVDCADPHLLARFWAAALGYEVEDHHDMIEGIIADGYATAEDTVTIDGRMAWRDAAACRPPSEGLPRLLFQVVPEPKAGKNRVHLDVHSQPEDRDAEVGRLVGLGATRLYDGRQGPQTWVTMADPEGNEFCIA